MRVSMNILLDVLDRYNHDLGGSIHEGLSFQAISLLPRNLEMASPGILYICRLSEAIRTLSSGTHLNCMCIRDRIKDALETPDALSGMVIINENIELEDLFCEVQGVFTLVSNWCEQMQEAVIQERSMQVILNMSEAVIGNFISISDSSLALLAYTKKTPTDDPISLYLIENGYHSEETVRKFKMYKRYETWTNSEELIVNESSEIAKHTIVSRAFTFNDTYFMHVVMSCNHRRLTPGLLDLFEYLTRILVYCVRKEWEKEKSLSNMYNSLFKDLMSGKLRERERVYERARIIGLSQDSEYYLLLLTEDLRGNASFPGYMTQEISQMFPSIKPVLYNPRLVLLLQSPGSTCLAEQQDMWEKLNAYFQKNNVFCGVSEVFDDLLDIPDAYQQAETALHEGIIDGAERNAAYDETSELRNIAHFDKYYACCLLDRSEKAERFWKSSQYGKKLLRLHKNDIDKQTNNMKVLYTYLKHERRAADAAAVLHMHRNNVSYRIARIEEMLGLSLDDLQTRSNLLMSLLLYKYFGYDNH